MEEENRVTVSEEDLPLLSFMPVWIYHFVCLAAFPPARVDKRALIHALEAYTCSVENGVAGFMVGYLKFNLHKLFELHYLDLESPDFSSLENNLVSSIDLLQTSTIEQQAFLSYQQFLRDFAFKVAGNPMIHGEISEEDRKSLMAKALLVRRMLS